MRTNKVLAGIILLSSYPILYYTWVKSLQNTWVTTLFIQLENDIIHQHPDILRPEIGRFAWKDPKQ